MNAAPEAAGAAASGRVRTVAVLSLLAGALVWGLIWYPYRVLRDAGVGGVAACTMTYGVAFVLGLAMFRKAWPRWRWQAKLLPLGLAAGACNLGYVLATLDGEVVRVLLLFYLAPLWTVLLSRLLLGERLNRFGALVVALSLAGAATVLWRPAIGWPLPHNASDWLGLGAGISFALFNVLSRYAREIDIELKSMASFAGVVVVGVALMLLGLGSPQLPADNAAWLMLGAIGLILIVINLVVQFGLTHLPANRAIVIMLCEVAIAAVAAWWLAGEAFGWQESVGGAMIVAASLFSSRLEQE